MPVFFVALGCTVRVYGSTTVVAETPEDAAREVLDAAAEHDPERGSIWYGISEIERGTAIGHSIIDISDETGETAIGQVDLVQTAPFDDVLIDVDALAERIAAARLQPDPEPVFIHRSRQKEAHQ
ncbi:hypothetical protein JI664_21505 [Rhodobacter sp. NTK016B]|uniref:hypothetical protein n=1 Tax=Rhodobacter sp. NTK016B TaxID=2759676 RepID=UPI001A907094|nr:hypothetical protein [Rhodobacter sp. NTK016B]MBN8294564.1 hypothetical protein [Rhodobacter sp. NTK016B]